MTDVIAILEDNADRIGRMRTCLSAHFPELDQMYFESAPLMRQWLGDHLGEVVLISLDHDLPIQGDCGTGRDIANYLATFPPSCPVIVHTSNEHFAPGMMFVLSDAGWPTARVYPHDQQDWVVLGWVDAIRGCVKAGLLNPSPSRV
jgi:hypothetical protein